MKDNKIFDCVTSVIKTNLMQNKVQFDIYIFRPFLLSLLFVGLFSNKCLAQSDEYVQETIEVYENRIYKDFVKTPTLFLTGLPLSYPILNLSECNLNKTSINLRFDDLEGDVKDYYYTLVHCNNDWTISNLNKLEYISGFTEMEIQDYEYSFNTYTEFTHYSLKIPNQDMCITKSGNYILLVYLDGDIDNLVLSQRFMVVDTKVQVVSNIDLTSSAVGKARSHQEVDFKIQHPDFTIKSPQTDLKVSILQNGRWDNSIINITPKFVHPESLDYNYQGELIFPAAREFRNIDMRTFRFNTEKIKGILLDSDVYDVYLYPDNFARDKNFLYWMDVNGKFVIMNNLDNNVNTISISSKTSDTSGRSAGINQNLSFENEALNTANIECDYAWVHFYVDRDYAYDNSDLYLIGKLTEYSLDDKYRMLYNSEHSRYELKLFLKQGYYNYQYALVDKASNQFDISDTEGNWYQTKNDYMILVYFRPFGKRYDQLIGHRIDASGF